MKYEEKKTQYFVTHRSGIKIYCEKFMKTSYFYFYFFKSNMIDMQRVFHEGTEFRKILLSEVVEECIVFGSKL